MDESAQAKTHRDYTGSKIGMWLFLISEVFFFFGPFLLYSVFRYRFPSEFSAGSRELDLFLGTLNTALLLTSSLFVAVSVSAVKRGNRNLAAFLLVLTVLFGLAFLFNKYTEWDARITGGVYPGSAALLQQGKGKVIFYGLYFFMTGFHGLHVLAGVVLMGFMAVFVMTGAVRQGDFIKLENSGLYWHLVDIIWIYLFPLFYLVS